MSTNGKVSSTVQEEGEIPITDEKKAKSSICEICLKTESKYKCPRCLTKTCSLSCCRQHKANAGCSGERDKTQYVDKEQFDERLLLNDYRFLEEQSRLVDNLQRNIDEVAKPVEAAAALKPIHGGVYEHLRKFVYRHFGIQLQLMPQQSTRHVFNRTRFNRSLGLVSWSLEFVFYLPTQSNNSSSSGKQNSFFRFSTKNYIFSFKLTLKQVLINFYKKFKNDLFNLNNRNLNQQFAFVFENENFDDAISILYEIIDTKQRKRYFKKLKLELTLEENLSNKTILEYPSLYVVPNENLSDFVVVEHEHDDGDRSNLVADNQNKEHDEEEEEEPEEGEGKLIHEECLEDRRKQDASMKRFNDEKLVKNGGDQSPKRLRFQEFFEPAKREEGEELEDGEI